MKQFPFLLVNKWLVMPQSSQSHLPGAHSGDQATTFPQLALSNHTKGCLNAQPASRQRCQIYFSLVSPTVEVPSHTHSSHAIPKCCVFPQILNRKDITDLIARYFCLTAALMAVFSVTTSGMYPFVISLPSNYALPL